MPDLQHPWPNVSFAAVRPRRTISALRNDPFFGNMTLRFCSNRAFGIKHKLLGKPLQISPGIKLCCDLLAGPSPLGMELASAH
jgi:hypothetical protein